MTHIYGYKEDFNRSNVIDRMNALSEIVEEEMEKPDGERDDRKAFEMMYAQYMAGLRLSTGSTLY